MNLGARIRQERQRRHLSQEALAEALGTVVKSISRWERGQAVPQAYYRLQLCRLFDIHPAELFEEPGDQKQETGEPPAFWSVPYQRNLHFTGRAELLEQLDQRLFLKREDDQATIRPVALVQTLAVKGLGGIGKTQIAIEYAYRARERKHDAHIFWIPAASEEAIMASFVRFAHMLSLAAETMADQPKLVAEIICWFEQCQQDWLLIFDNVEDISLVRRYFPRQGSGSILMTTRSNAVASIAIPFEVDQLSVMEGTEFLLRRTCSLDVSDEESNRAINVVIALDGFPLALDQAGAYIEETGCSFEAYLQLYYDYRNVLLARRGIQSTSYPDSVTTTWSLCFQKVELVNPAAADLLRLCAFLAPDFIPEELLSNGAPHWPVELQLAVSDRLTFNQMIEDLLKFSLVKRFAEERCLSLHRLVQTVQMDALAPEAKRQWAERVIRAMHSAFPETVEMSTRQQLQRYLSQAQVCYALIQDYAFEFAEATALLAHIATYLEDLAFYEQAECLFQRVLQISERKRGPDDSAVAEALNNLATLYGKQSRHDEAEPLFLRALQIWEHNLGPDHPRVASVLKNMATLYKDQARYIEAEPLFLRALHIWEQNFGPEYPDLARPLNGLANVYSDQGKYSEAEPLFLRALRIREQCLGPDHPDVASLLNNLASLCSRQGKYSEAEPLFLRALRIREQCLGPDHPLVAFPLNNLAHLYKQEQRYSEAEPLFLRALRIREQCLGPDHPNVAYPLNHLASLYHQQGKDSEAERLSLRALQIWERSLGSDHPAVAYALNNLAQFSFDQGKYSEAEAFFLRALRIREDSLGPAHPFTQDMRKQFDLLLRTMRHNPKTRKLEEGS
jgi:tetratricopeptide (TPR) repeat protein/transcriptional regulator with XRE-family HTH domain